MVNEITVVGLGAGELDQLPLGIYRLITGATVPIYVRTKDHPVVSQLESEGVTFQSFDELYEKYDQFEQVYEDIYTSLINASMKTPIIYAVPGHPLVAERTVQLLLERNSEKVKIVGGQSFIDPMFASLQIDPIEGFQFLDGTNLTKDEIEITQHLIISQVYDTFTASEVKLTLMELLPDDYEVYIVTAAGSSEEQLKKIPLYELDRVVSVNNLTSVYVPPVKEETILYKRFSKLRNIIAQLRGPKGCPWDRKQTHQSLKKYLLEEAYELIEAIEEEDIDHMIEELGDVLLQVMLHSQIGEDEGYFSIDDVIEGISDKMIRRHPHVFGTIQVDTVDEVLDNWNEIKKKEKKIEAHAILSNYKETHLPNLLRAYEIQKKAAKVGFDWDKVEDAWKKVKEELSEFEEEMSREAQDDRLIKEFGDVLFALVNVARFYKMNPEEALFLTNQKFLRRFSYIENKVNELNKRFEDFTLEQLDHFWNEAKEKGL